MKRFFPIFIVARPHLNASVVVVKQQEELDFLSFMVLTMGFVFILKVSINNLPALSCYRAHVLTLVLLQ